MTWHLGRGEEERRTEPSCEAHAMQMCHAIAEGSDVGLALSRADVVAVRVVARARARSLCRAISLCRTASLFVPRISLRRVQHGTCALPATRPAKRSGKVAQRVERAESVYMKAKASELNFLPTESTSPPTCSSSRHSGSVAMLLVHLISAKSTHGFDGWCR